jgi:hypothetical protein
VKPTVSATTPPVKPADPPSGDDVLRNRK